MNGLRDTGEPWGIICQVVDRDFYPLGDVSTFRIQPWELIGLVVKDIKQSMRKTISDLGLIDDPDSIIGIGATLWKLSTPYLIAKRDKPVVVEELLKNVRHEQRRLVEELDESLGILDYFDENPSRGHLHVLLQLAISGADGANPF
jgi:hypothetical protein